MRENTHCILQTHKNLWFDECWSRAHQAKACGFCREEGRADTLRNSGYFGTGSLKEESRYLAQEKKDWEWRERETAKERS